MTPLFKLRALEGLGDERVVAAVAKQSPNAATAVKSTPGGWVTVARGVQFVPTTGRYRARASAPGGKRVSAGASSIEEAIALQTALEQQVATLGETAPEVSVRAWVTTWLDRRAAAGVRSVRSERDRAKKHLFTARFANKSLGNLRRAEVLAWIRELKSTHVDLEGQRVGWARKKAAADNANGKTPKRAKRRRSGEDLVRANDQVTPKAHHDHHRPTDFHKATIANRTNADTPKRYALARQGAGSIDRCGLTARQAA